jgi:hypothetical protein
MEIDMGTPLPNWRDGVRPFEKASQAISRVVLVVKGFQNIEFAAIMELARMFSECRPICRIDRSDVCEASGMQILTPPPHPDKHVLIDSIPYTRHSLHRDAGQMFAFVGMIAGIGRATRNSSIKLDAMRRRIFNAAFDVSVPRSDEKNRAMIKSSIGSG